MLITGNGKFRKQKKWTKAYGTEDFLRSDKFDYELVETQELTLTDQEISK